MGSVFLSLRLSGMSMKRFPVRVSFGVKGTVYTPEFQTEDGYKTGWQSVLKRAYRQGTVECLCSGFGKKRLAIRRYDGTDVYGLARMPYTGQEHYPECHYYCADHSSSGLSAYQSNVVEELASGDVRIRLAFGIEKADAKRRSNAEASTTSHRGTGQAVMSLLGLLHLLWSESRLNSWFPSMAGKRNINLVHYLLREVANGVLVRSTKLNEVLLLATTAKGGAQAEQNGSCVEHARAHGQRLVVVAPLARHSDARQAGNEGVVPIFGFHGIPALQMANHVWQDTLKRFPRQVSAWREGMRLIAIMHAELAPGARPTATVLDMALMAVSEQWIPVESSHEARVEQHLRDSQRSFEKPLAFDANEETVFPDFWLLDGQGRGRIPMEVFGMDTIDYQKRKEQEFLHYNETYGVTGWWYWDVTTRGQADQLPALPERRA